MGWCLCSGGDFNIIYRWMVWLIKRADSHGVPSPKSIVTWGQFEQSQPLKVWKLGLTTSHMVPSLKSPSMTWKPTWQHFLEVRLRTCVESWIEQKDSVREPQHFNKLIFVLKHLGPMMQQPIVDCIMSQLALHWPYRNTIVGSPLGEQIFIFFEKIRFASQKLSLPNFYLAKILVKMTINSLEVTKCCKN